ncbi:MAG: hypothetical protein KatS3mg002_0697 [Candidatus Woesearchaeota archaeon]|nr:MAG: hypothetical protein KatS3mg002_0697 [Candidatus Woesearchaeota archaeon]
MNLLKDGVLVTLITSSLAGSPRNEPSLENKLLNDQLFNNKKEPELYLDKINSRALSYSEIRKYLDKAYSKIKTPEYINLAVQLARSYVESKDNPYAVSNAGARGLYQIMEESWNEVMNEYSFDHAFDPYLNNIASLKHILRIDTYLRQNYPGFEELPLEQKRDLLNAAYNGGQGRLKSVGWDINAMPKETRDYVKKMRERTLEEEMKLYGLNAKG